MAGPNTWDIMPPIPDIYPTGGGYSIRGADAAGGKIWALLWHNDTTTFKVWCYVPELNAWVPRATTNTAGTSAGSTHQFRAMGDWLYHYDSSRHIRYNWVTNTWQTNLTPAYDPTGAGDPNLIGGWYNAAAYPITSDKMAYLGGGQNTSYARGQISVYNATTDTWHYGGPPYLTIGTQNNDFYVGRIGSKLYSYRGSTGVNGYDTHFEIDIPTVLAAGHPATVETEPMPHAYRYIGGCSDGERMWKVGGHHWAASDATETVYYWKPGDTSWTQVANHPQSQGTHSINVMRLGDYIWTVGGAFDTRAAEYSLCRYTPAFALPYENTPTEEDEVTEDQVLEIVQQEVAKATRGLILPHIIKPDMDEPALRRAIQQNFDAVSGWARQFTRES